MTSPSISTNAYTAIHRMADSESADERVVKLSVASLEAVKRHGHGLDPQMHAVIRNAFYSGAAFSIRPPKK